MRRRGSSPLAWGTGLWLFPSLARRRFIPTRVGNSAPGPSRCSMGTVHPHSRGEQLTTRFTAITLIGSSPLAWGTGNRDNYGRIQRRFIPTRVGNRPAGSVDTCRLAVHPHSRGEQYAIRKSNFKTLRFIPTRVGNRTNQKWDNLRNSVHPHSRGEQFFVFLY